MWQKILPEQMEAGVWTGRPRHSDKWQSNRPARPQGTNGDDYYTMRYRMRPQYVANLRLWSLDENLGMDAQALQQELKEKEYEYFALYAIDDFLWITMPPCLRTRQKWRRDAYTT